MNKRFVNQSLPQRSSKIKIIIGIIAIVILVVGILVGYNSYAKTQEKNYIADLKIAGQTMSEGAGKSETLSQLTTEVWYNSIHNVDDEKTNPYTADTKDFNEALIKLYDSESTQELMEAINANQAKVMTLITKLKDPPAKMEGAYDALMATYTNYKGQMALSIKPTGSYNEYEDTFEVKAEEFDSAYNELQRVIDSIEQ